jgi:hypothetical protein
MYGGLPKGSTTKHSPLDCDHEQSNNRISSFSHIFLVLCPGLLQFQMATMESVVKSFKGSLFSGLEPHEEWNSLAPMTTERFQFGAVALDDGYRILAVGGYHTGACVRLKSVEVYDSRTNKWTSEGWPDLNVARGSCAVTLCNCKVYVVGGTDAHGKHIDSQSIECLDLHSLPLEWKVLECRLSIARCACCAVGVGKFVYVMGGENMYKSLDSVEILDTETGLISEGPSLTTPRNGAGAALVDNAIWVIGGSIISHNDWEHDEHLSTVESIKFDPRTGRLLKSSWAQCPARMSTSRGRYGQFLAVATIGQCLVVTGGGGYRDRSVEILNAESQEWWDLPNMIIGLNGGMAVALGNSCIVVLGFSRGGEHTVESLSFTQASSKVPSLAHLSELAIMERLPEFGSVTTLLDWAEDHNAVHLKKACLALIAEHSDAEKRQKQEDSERVRRQVSNYRILYINSSSTSHIFLVLCRGFCCNFRWRRWSR